MKKKDKAKKISEILNGFYPSPPIPLQHDNHYTLLIAVLLSAQCTDKRVNIVTPQLFALANRAEKMVQVSVQKIQEVIRSCGLAPRKARFTRGSEKHKA